MFDLPKRISLAGQTAASIRKAIQQGVWTHFIPSERRLCEMFKVSRPTIRRALNVLANEGILEIRQGKRHRLLVPPVTHEKSINRLVGLVTNQPVSEMSPTSYRGISEMCAHLTEHGFTTEVLVCPLHAGRSQRRKLEAFVRENRVFCCVLMSVSKDLQLWFGQNAIPALVVGSCHPGVKLPSLDVDHEAACRHAVGVFLRRGHRRVALVVPNSGVAGDLVSERGFKEGFERSAWRDEARALVVRHTGTAQNIAHKLDMLFNSALPPTALLVAKPRHVFAVIVYLLKRGISVPDKVSLIARDQDPSFESVTPTISHYKFEGDAFVHLLTRLMLKLVSHEALPLKPTLIVPKFFDGGTVQRPPH